MLAQIQIFIEIALSALLLLGIAFNFHISKTLSSLKNDRANLLKLIEKLETSIKNAHDGVEKLRVAGQVSGRPLTRTIEQARIVSSELDTLVDRAESKADKLTEVTNKASAREQILGKLLDDAADLKLDLLRRIEAPLIEEPENEGTSSSFGADETGMATLPPDMQDRKISPIKQSQPDLLKHKEKVSDMRSSTPFKQRYEKTFLGGPVR